MRIQEHQWETQEHLIYTYIYIYIYREREREQPNNKKHRNNKIRWDADEKGKQKIHRENNQHYTHKRVGTCKNIKRKGKKILIKNRKTSRQITDIQGNSKETHTNLNILLRNIIFPDRLFYPSSYRCESYLGSV